MTKCLRSSCELSLLVKLELAGNNPACIFFQSETDFFSFFKVYGNVRMMNTAANVTAASAMANMQNAVTIMKSAANQQTSISLQPTNMMPTIITSNERFTIHTPSQSIHNLPNNLVASVPGSTAASQHQIQAVNASAALIHSTNIVNNVSTISTTMIPSTVQHQVIPVAVTGQAVSVLKGQPTMAALPIGQRFQTTNVITSSGPASASPINTLFIHHDRSVNKGQTVAISATPATSQHHQTPHPNHLQLNTVINASVSVAGPAASVAPSHQTIPAAHSGPLYIQTNQQAQTNSSALLHAANVGIVPPQPTNLPTSNAQQQTQAQLSQSQFQRLKVEDALSYLDQVKLKFSDQPQVYNDFLDIMKEFKSQSIDTPGVIQRVSTLFCGHPELIVGFNTFLPPGYKIEIQANDQVNVSMPNSTSVVLMAGPIGHPNAAPVSGSTLVTGPGAHQLSGNLARNTALVTPNLAANTSAQQPQQAGHAQVFSLTSMPSRDSPQSNNVSALHSTVSLNNTANQSRPESNIRVVNNHAVDTISNRSVVPHPVNSQTSPQQQPVEFDHAISYVNKIKSRFSKEPEVYKQFLDILQGYQREQAILKETSVPPPGQKFLTESEVFAQVAKLFQNENDLLQEFGQFLPDSNGGSSSVHGSNLLPTNNSTNLINSLSAGNNNLSSVSNYNLTNQASINYSHNTTAHPENVQGTGSFVQTVSLAPNDHSSMMKKPIIQMSSNSNKRGLVNAPFTNIQRGPIRPSGNVNSVVPPPPLDQQISPIKRSKLTPTRDSSLADAAKYMGDLHEYAFFDKVRQSCNSSCIYIFCFAASFSDKLLKEL